MLKPFRVYIIYIKFFFLFFSLSSQVQDNEHYYTMLDNSVFFVSFDVILRANLQLLTAAFDY